VLSSARAAPRMLAAMTATADLLDQHGERALVCRAPFRSFGGREVFEGPIATVRCPEDNVLLRAALTEPGDGRVLVVDGGGSLRVALMGDRVGALAVANGWAGVVINGAVRDVAALRALPVGIVALGSTPRPSVKAGLGEAGVPVTFGEVTFRPGASCYRDEDGLVVLDEPADDLADP